MVAPGQHGIEPKLTAPGRQLSHLPFTRPAPRRGPRAGRLLARGGAGAEAAPTPEPPKATSVTDLLADLGRTREELETKETGGMQEPTITYCPAYPPSTVVSLVRGGVR